MFDILCVKCKRFDTEDGCALGLAEDGCPSFSPLAENIKDKPDCGVCVWFSDGCCDFDRDDPKDCRNFKTSDEEIMR